MPLQNAILRSGNTASDGVLCTGLMQLETCRFRAASGPTNHLFSRVRGTPYDSPEDKKEWAW